MNGLFLKFISLLAFIVFLLTLASGTIIIHVRFLVAKRREPEAVTYIAFIKKWLVHRALPISLLLAITVGLTTIGAGMHVASYRTKTFHHLTSRNLMLRIYDQNSISESNGTPLGTHPVIYSTTNSNVISEFIDAIRFSPTFPGYGCMCEGDGRKFELGKLAQDGAVRPIKTFTIHHEQNLRFTDDWYGDWHLWSKSQEDFASWQKKYVDNAIAETNSNRVRIQNSPKNQ